MSNVTKTLEYTTRWSVNYVIALHECESAGFRGNDLTEEARRLATQRTDAEFLSVR